MKLMTIKVPDTLFEEISREAAIRKMSRSEIARQRLASNKGARTPSLWDRMKDLVVEDDDLPKDLSSNKKHMQGYGKGRSDR